MSGRSAWGVVSGGGETARQPGEPLTGRPGRLLLLCICCGSNICSCCAVFLSRSVFVFIVPLPPPLLKSTLPICSSPHPLPLIPSRVLGMRQRPDIAGVDAAMEERHGIDRRRKAAVAVEGDRTGDGR